MTTTAPDLGSRLRRHRSTLLIGGGLLLAVAVTIGFGAAGIRTSALLDPDNPDAQGGRAVARVLADQGVAVRVVRSAGELERTRLDASTTVLVTNSELLGASTADRLLTATGPALLVIAEPGPGTTDALGLAAESVTRRTHEPVAADCSDPRYADLSLAVDQLTQYDGSGCWSGRNGAVLVEPEPDVLLWGAAQAWTNDQVLRADNAATALRLLGQRERLVWYVPSLNDLVADDGVSLATLLPRWLRPGLVLSFLATVALIGWRGRRLGPLATEPLPVVVKAIETTRSRGRLYRKAGDRSHASAALRRAARRQLAEHLRADPRDRNPDALLREVADQLGRPLADIERLLGPDAPTPPTDHDLITLASELAALDREVRHP